MLDATFRSVDDSPEKVPTEKGLWISKRGDCTRMFYLHRFGWVNESTILICGVNDTTGEVYVFREWGIEKKTGEEILSALRSFYAVYGPGIHVIEACSPELLENWKREDFEVVPEDTSTSWVENIGFLVDNKKVVLNDSCWGLRKDFRRLYSPHSENTRLPTLAMIVPFVRKS